MLFWHYSTGSTLLSLWQKQRPTAWVENRGDRRKIANCIETTTGVEFVHYWIEVWIQSNGFGSSLSHCKRRCHEFDGFVQRCILAGYNGQSGEKILKDFPTVFSTLNSGMAKHCGEYNRIPTDRLNYKFKRQNGLLTGTEADKKFTK